jgi:hypothetical protein
MTTTAVNAASELPSPATCPWLQHTQAAADVLCSCLLREPAALSTFLTSPNGMHLLLRMLRCGDASVAFQAVVVLATCRRVTAPLPGGQQAAKEGWQADVAAGLQGRTKEHLQPQQRLPLLLAAMTAVGQRLAAVLDVRPAPRGPPGSGSPFALAETPEDEEDTRLAWMDYGSLGYWVLTAAAAPLQESDTILASLHQAGELLQAAVAHSWCGGSCAARGSGSVAVCCLAGAVASLAGCTQALEGAVRLAAQQGAETAAAAAAAEAAAAEAVQLAAEASSATSIMTPASTAQDSINGLAAGGAPGARASTMAAGQAVVDVGAAREAAAEAAVRRADAALSGLRGVLAFTGSHNGSDAAEVSKGMLGCCVAGRPL